MADTPQENGPTRQIALIASCMGWGSMHGSAERGPKLLLDAGLADRVGAKKVTIIESDPPFATSGISNTQIEEAIARHTSRVSDAVEESIEEGLFPLVIGGDHTSAIGLYSGLSRAHGEVGVTWIDTHPDLNTPETTPSGNIHGMVLAVLLGQGSSEMRDTSRTANINEANVAMVGIRSIDPGEQRWLDEGKIQYMTMDDVNEVGLEHCLAKAMQTANNATAGFGITIDLDAIDPSVAPFVATPVDGGFGAEELVASLQTIPRVDRLLGMEVTEFTPRNDGDVEVACELVASLVTAATGQVVDVTS